MWTRTFRGPKTSQTVEVVVHTEDVVVEVKGPWSSKETFGGPVETSSNTGDPVTGPLTKGDVKEDTETSDKTLYCTVTPTKETMGSLV